VSTAMLQVHQSKCFPGGIVASLSIPWGSDRGDEAIGGYHALWPRDMVQAALGKLACGDAASARQTLFYLETLRRVTGIGRRTCGLTERLIGPPRKWMAPASRSFSQTRSGGRMNSTAWRR